MLFSKVNAYQSNQAAGTQAPTQIKVAQTKMASTLKDMKPGQVFEGTVNEVKNGQVKIALSNGQTISASLGTKVSMNEGDTMFFQVKSTSDNAIYIKPYTSAAGQNINPILYKALEAANLAITEKNLQLVDAMMQEGMGIDKQSLGRMSQVVSGFNTNDITSLVQMQKLGLELTESNFNQFVNYKNNEQAFLTELNTLTGQLANVYESGENTPQQILQLNDRIVGMLEETPVTLQQTVESNAQGQATAALDPKIPAQEDGLSQMAQGAALQASADTEEMLLQSVPGNEPQLANAQSTQGQGTQPVTIFLEQLVSQTEQGEENAETAQMQRGSLASADAEEVAVQQSVTYQPNSAGAVLGQQGILNLSSQMMQVPQLAADGKLFQGNVLNPNLTKEQVLQEIANILGNSNLSEEEQMLARQLLSGKEYQTLLNHALMDQWTLTPKLVAEKQNIEGLYERLQQQMEQISEAVKLVQGESADKAFAGAKSVMSNLEFMNQVNQLYNYVQIPLKMLNQNVHSDLFVYTNKRNLADREGDLSCLLHLDMENLGPTDVYVKMHGTSVHTDFSLADDKSYELIMNNIHILESRLNDLGYSCEVNVKNTQEKQDFVKDFLEQEERVGTIKRYSFDMKA
ncbi:flagellar hook-length control protein FliK [Eubacterium oxidoreducens]|uniref:Hook-length control protein FliK n=1 Tax=Eubacterium oxidoreducens TaxID=1732 RepID=A0A1G6C4P9_EUBOX|nr:flagellar hook-length control protein FliK [Eubacterium oxidoreducens]SDB27856.1 hook-length control protein FliK [Eubacterium oxidoreducens]